MKKLLLIITLFTAIAGQAEIHMTYCDPATKELKIKNFGNTAVNVATYQLCSSFQYKSLSAANGISILSGDFNLDPNEEVYFSWTDATTGFSVNMDDMGLYLSSNFADPNSMVDFVQWGAGDQGREDVAVLAGLWVEDQFMSVPGPYYYIGDGLTNGPIQWSLSQGGGPDTSVRINELDPDQPSADTGEFIELFGTPGTPLDGLVLVLFQGSQNDVAYASFDLDGYALDGNGFFVVGNAAVPNVGLIISDNTIQNGEDGVALYVGDAANWSSGEVATSANLIDALVYGTDDPEDTGMLAVLTPGQPQLNDSPNSVNSFSRVPDGGDAFFTSQYEVQTPTPGASNLPACQGGNVSVASGNTDQCIENDNDPVVAITDSEFGDNYLFILSDANFLILESNTSGIFELDAYGVGTFHINGFSYNGEVDLNSLLPGASINGINATLCGNASLNNITIVRVACNAPICDGGSLIFDDNNTYISVCKDENPDPISFSVSSNGDQNYSLFLLDDNQNIENELTVFDLDLNTFAPGTYYIGGVSYDGNLADTTIESGDAFANILNENGTCLSFSTSLLQFLVQECTLGEGCVELYFSEYIEGSANNKAIEIYNPTPFPANLDNYDILGYFNGSTSPGPVIALAGTLAPGETYLIVNSQADASLLSMADITGSIATFNGDDALVLTHDLVEVDVIGIPGVDPGVSWDFGVGSTSNKTLVRKPEVTAPTTDWSISQGQWDIYNIDYFNNAGSHLTFGCGGIAIIGFTASSQQVDETDGTATIEIQSFNVGVPLEVVIDLAGYSATPDEDFTNIFPITLTFDSQNTVQSFDVPLLDDEIQEVFEYFTLSLTVNTELANVTNSTHTISIEPSDQTYPDYSIEEITAISNSNGVPDSIGVFCTIRGIVHGINFNPSGTHFHLIEENAGIKIFDANEGFGYTVTEGDSVYVRGYVAQFYGMTEFYADSIEFRNGGHPLETPLLMTGPLTEDQESRMVRIDCVKLVDPDQWTNELSGFDVDITDGVNTYQMHIDLDTDIYGTDAPAGHFSVTGIGAQFDTSAAPYDGGYQIWPRYLADFDDVVTASFIEFGDIVYGDAGVALDFINTSDGESSWFWEFGDGTTSNEQFPSHTYSYEFLSTVSEVTITLTVDNGNGCSDTFAYTANAIYTAITELEAATVKIYPNPAREFVRIQSESPVAGIELMDTAGRIIERTSYNQGILAIGHLPAGIYQIAIYTNAGRVTTLLVKE